MNLFKKAQEAAGVATVSQPLSAKPAASASAASAPSEHRRILYRLPQQLKDERGTPLKEESGVRAPYTEEELRRYKGTDYANGMLVASYEGWARNKDSRHGHGVYTYTRGEQFEGEWKANKRNGLGMLTMNTGHKYEGEWKDDKMNGEGREVFAKGEVFIGEYAKGRMHGKGLLDYYHTGTVFEGSWEEGRKHGKGRILYTNGDVFEGVWQHGRRHGAGKTTYAKDGAIYSSEWADGKMVGDMTFVGRSNAPQPRVNHRDPRIKQDKKTLVPLELASFRPKSDSHEVTSEQLLRLQIAFEQLDRDFIGVISIRELEEVWAKQSDKSHLEALDREQTGSVDLYSLFTSWYPLVPRRDIERYLSTYMTPDEVLRHRGECCGVVSTSHGKGFLHICGGQELTLERLKSVGSTIGGERFSEALYKKALAKTGKNTISFIEMLDVAYPNVNYNMLARSEVTYLPDEDVLDIQEAYANLESNGMLIVQDFEAAQLAWQNWLSECSSPMQDGTNPKPTTPFSQFPNTPDSQLYRTMVPGPFLGEPVWPMGPLSVTVKMLQSIDNMKGGYVLMFFYQKRLISNFFFL